MHVGDINGTLGSKAIGHTHITVQSQMAQNTEGKSPQHLEIR